jgi:hypothetical protein
LKSREWEDKLEEANEASTPEKRRDQRAEVLDTFLGSLKPEDRQGVMGKVNQYTKATGVKVVDAQESVYDLTTRTKKLREEAVDHVFTDLPPITRRTPQQRIEAMVRRLKAASPLEIEPILREIKYEYWKAGTPVTEDALRTVASHFLNQAERKRQ